MMKKCKCEFKCQIEDTHDEVMKVMMSFLPKPREVMEAVISSKTKRSNGSNGAEMLCDLEVIRSKCK